MEIIVGSIPPLGQKASPANPSSSKFVEAKVLHVRPPRKGIAGPSGMERREKKARDPRRGRVLTIMVPDGDTLPKDIDKGNYKVIMRFQKLEGCWAEK